MPDEDPHRPGDGVHDTLLEAAYATRYNEDRHNLIRVDVPNASPAYRCCECGQVWSPMLQRGGRFPRGWWRCPSGCNAP